MMKSIYDIPIYCINLKKDIDRKYNINLQLRNKNIKFIDAIYAKNINENKLINIKNISKRDYWSNEIMDTGEVGCLLSHLKTYQEALTNETCEYISVIEDDINLISYYNIKLDKFIIDNINNYDCIQLCPIISKSFIDLKYNFNDQITILDWNKYNSMLYPNGFSWSTGFYIISRKAMLKLLNLYLITDELMPADYYIYKNVKTGTLFPPISFACDLFESNLRDNIYAHNFSSKYLINTFALNKYVFITCWFGKLPNYFNLWLFSIKNKKYDILFITDQKIENYVSNLKIINMDIDELNSLIIRKFKYNIKLKNSSKLVDLKPALGYLFYEYIFNYEYWGWTDIDMISGNIINKIETYPNQDIYSFGKESFGPMMLFSIKNIDIYKNIENYFEILNDYFICKVDENWWFIDNKNMDNLSIYIDQNIYVKYYDGNNLINYILKKKHKIFDWNKICVNIDWNIKNTIRNNNEVIYNYNFEIGENLLKNKSEIFYCHLTSLKKNKKIMDEINDHINKYLFDDIKHISLNIKYSSNLNYNDNVDLLNNYNVYDIYDKFINMEFTIDIIT